jgi:hypothetical protein
MEIPSELARFWAGEPAWLEGLPALVRAWGHDEQGWNDWSIQIARTIHAA